MFDAFIAKHQPANPVASLQGNPGTKCAQLGCGDGFEVALRAKEHAHALIDKNQGRAVAFFGKAAHKWLAVAH